MVKIGNEKVEEKRRGLFNIIDYMLIPQI